MIELTYTLLGDGPTDRKLQPVVEWVLRQYTDRVISGYWADLSIVPSRPRSTRERVIAALQYYPADVLVVHRDAERQSLSSRVQEIMRAVPPAATQPVVALVPVRMTEAWFLFNEQAIRSAAGNPRGTHPLELPPSARSEVLPDPKAVLEQALITASDLKGRHLKRFNVLQAAARVAELIDDYAPLRDLSAFQQFESLIRTLAQEQHW